MMANEECLLPSDGIPQHFLDILPQEFQYKFLQFSTQPSLSNEPRYCTTFRATMTTKAQANEWLEKFQCLSLMTWRVLKTWPENSSRIVHKKKYRCQHNTLAGKNHYKKANAKHTGCMARLIITVQQLMKKPQNKSDIKGYPCLISFENVHNHLVFATASISHRDPAPEVREKFISLFSCHTPASAIKVHKRDLQLEYEDDYHNIAADRRHCPDNKWVYKVFYSTFKETYGKGYGSEMLEKLSSTIAEYNVACKCECAKIELGADGRFVVAICSPLMHRVHENIQTAAELVCLDSFDHMGWFQCKVFLLMVHSSIGGLPLGMMITSSTSEETITTAITLLKSIIPSRAFFGNRSSGPTVFVTDNSAVERKSLHNAFPNSAVLLCIFHILQAAWRHIWDSKTGVEQNDKIVLFSYVEELVYCQSEEDLSCKFLQHMHSDLFKKYDRFTKYYEHLYSRKEEWAICLRHNLPIRGHYTNNFIEPTVQMLKDTVLRRTEVHNLVQLFSNFSVDVDDYYRQKILCSISGRPDAHLKLVDACYEKKIVNLEIRLTDTDSIYSVYNSTTSESHYVNVKASVCSCSLGLSVGACKHQFAVFKQYGFDNSQVLPATTTEKSAFYYIATGNKDIPTNWDVGLQAANDKCLPELREIQTEVMDCSDEENYPVDEVMAEIQEFADGLKEKIRKNPSKYCRAVKTFLSNAKSMKTDAAFLSALVTFGNCANGGVQQPSCKKGRTITMHATGAAQGIRKVRSQNCAVTGVSKAVFAQDHGYSKRRLRILLPKSS